MKVLRIVFSLFAISLLFFSPIASYASHIFETKHADEADTKSNTGFDFTVISEGETKFIDVEARSLILLGDIHILIVMILGSGELGIAMEKSDTGGELILMTGAAISLNGPITTIFKMGFTPNALSQSVEIGDEDNPNGFIFLVTGVIFSLGGIEEGEYSIELAL